MADALIVSCGVVTLVGTFQGREVDDRLHTLDGKLADGIWPVVIVEDNGLPVPDAASVAAVPAR